MQLDQGLLWTDDTKSVKRLSVLLTLLLVVVVGCCRVGCVVACLPVENACKFAQRNPNQTNVQDGSNNLWVHLRDCSVPKGLAYASTRIEVGLGVETLAANSNSSSLNDKDIRFDILQNNN